MKRTASFAALAALAALVLAATVRAAMINGTPGDDYLVGTPDADVIFAKNVHERGLYRVEGCEHINWIDPTAEQAAEEGS